MTVSIRFTPGRRTVEVEPKSGETIAQLVARVAAANHIEVSVGKMLNIKRLGQTRKYSTSSLPQHGDFIIVPTQ